MTCNNDKPSVSGEIRAVQAELQELRDGAKAPPVPRTSRWASVHQSRWTPAAVAAIIAWTLPLLQQWQTPTPTSAEVREWVDQTRKLEARILTLERRVGRLK